MKVIRSNEINGYKILIGVCDRMIDGEATIHAIAEAIQKPVEVIRSLPNFSELFNAHKKYFPLNENEEEVSDEFAEEMRQRKEACTEHQILTVSGEIIPDYRNTEFWKKENDQWTKSKIENIGESPDGILDQDLTQEQRAEIFAQEKERRINALTSEQKAEELQGELDALADEAARLEKRAQIQGKAFDPVAYYNEKAPAIEAKYQ